MIQVVSFDLDDTLWAVQPVIRQANQTLYQWLDEHAPRFTQRYELDDFATLRERVVQAHPHWAHSVTAIRLAVLKLGLAESGYHGDENERLTREAFACFLEARNRVSLFDDAHQMLNRLKTRYRLVALSNGNADIQRVGLSSYFEFALNADGVGTAKPDPLMFHTMLERCGVAPQDVMHIGDSPAHDILGAQNAGLNSLWVNFDQSSWPLASPTPDIEVTTLKAIPAAIAAYDTARQ